MPVPQPSPRRDLLAHCFMVADEIRLRRKFGSVHHYNLKFYDKRVSRQQHTRKAETGEFSAVLPTSIKAQVLTYI
jgi:hypothetical protein